MTCCIRCGVDKPDSEFYAHPMMASGHLNKCKDCCKEQAKGYGKVWRSDPQKYQAKIRHDYEVWKRKTAYERAVKRDARLTKAETAAKAKVDNYYRVKRWMAAHPERRAEQSRRGAMKYYAQKKKAQGTATTEQIRQRWAYYGDRCWMCGDPATQTDHVIPLNRGGSDWPANQRPACGPCNRSKSDRLLAELAS